MKLGAALAFLMAVGGAMAADLTIGWNANTDFVDAYVVHWRCEGEEWAQDVGQATKVTVAGLTVGKRYDFWITARWGRNESAASSHVEGTFVSVVLERSADLKTWEVFATHGDLAEGEQRFYRANIPPL